MTLLKQSEVVPAATEKINMLEQSPPPKARQSVSFASSIMASLRRKKSQIMPARTDSSQKNGPGLKGSMLGRNDDGIGHGQGG